MATGVLFDIDHTLIDLKGAGARALSKALKALFGPGASLKGLELAGKTDFQIFKEALVLLGKELQEGLLKKICEAYLKFLEEELKACNGRILPGVMELLLRLQGMPEVYLGLLTGNLERGARLKLARFGLNSFFSVGAFGGDSEDRDELLPIAVERLERQKGISLSYGQCVIIGDTPRDVRCAKVHGALCIAVATGPFDQAALQEAGADLVLPDLSFTKTILDWLSKAV